MFANVCIKENSAVGYMIKLTTLRRMGSNDEQSFCRQSILRASTITLHKCHFDIQVVSSSDFIFCWGKEKLGKYKVHNTKAEREHNQAEDIARMF